MDRNVVYAYGQTQLVNNRYTRVNMTPSTTALQDVFTGKVNFLCLMVIGHMRYMK